MFCTKGTLCGADGKCKATCQGNCCKEVSFSHMFARCSHRMLCSSRQTRPVARVLCCGFVSN